METDFLLKLFYSSQFWVEVKRDFEIEYYLFLCTTNDDFERMWKNTIMKQLIVNFANQFNSPDMYKKYEGNVGKVSNDCLFYLKGSYDKEKQIRMEFLQFMIDHTNSHENE